MEEEQVAAHLAAEHDAVVQHLPLGQGMPGLPHERRAAVGHDVLGQRAGGLDVEEDRLAGGTGELPAGEDRGELVSTDQAAGAVHRRDPVAVAVQADAELGARLDHARLQGDHVLVHRGVGVVVREGAVHLAVEAVDLGADPPQQVRREETAGGVGRVEHQPDRARRIDPLTRMRTESGCTGPRARAATATTRAATA